MAEITTPSNPIVRIPSIVGPNVYELYTDAKYFITHVFVNDIKRRLSNAEGNGMMSRRGYSFQGAMGYKNKLLLNAFMMAGKNEIKVVFEPSDILEQAREQGAEKMIMGDMYAHAVIAKGRLNEDSSGVESYDLDQLIAAPERNAEVLTDQLLRRFDDAKLKAGNSVIVNIDVPETERALQATHVEFSHRSSCNYTAMLLLNDVPVKSLRDNVSSGEEDFFDALKPGSNKFTLQVESINETKDENTLELYLETDIESLVKDMNFPDGYSKSDFGEFFSHVYAPILTFTFPDAGEYTGEFTFEV